MFGRSLSLSSDGKILAVGSSSAKVWLFKYDPHKWNPEDRWTETQVFTGGNKYGEQLSMSGQGNRLIVGARLSNEGESRVYEARNNLNPSGGTTGQVLAKNSNSNYDYSWQAPQDSRWGTLFAALSSTLAVNVTNTIKCDNLITARGGNIYRIATDAYARMALDFNGVTTLSSSNKILLDGLYGNGHFVGYVYAAVFSATSDDRYKINERPITNAMQTLTDLQFYEYDKVHAPTDTEGYKVERGVIAQQLEGGPLSHAVDHRRPEKLAVSYQDVFITTAQAVKDLMAQVQALQDRVAALEAA